MSKLRVVPYRDMKRVAEYMGFRWVRCRGSHHTFRHEVTRQIIVIPDHGSEVLVRGLIKHLIDDMGLTPDEYHRILDEL